MELGIENALWMIKNRNYKNPITSLCILSDGSDTDENALQKIEKII